MGSRPGLHGDGFRRAHRQLRQPQGAHAERIYRGRSRRDIPKTAHVSQLPRMPGSDRRILLADADAFFVAVARMVDPEGAGKAPLLIVGGSAASRGVVCSASYETRKYGVRSAMPISRALKLCPDAMCVPVPGKACGVKSGDIRRVLERYSPIVEGASIDEWYMNMDGTEGVYHHEPLAVTAQRMREAVHRETGLTVSIGGGTNKMGAKPA